MRAERDRSSEKPQRRNPANRETHRDGVKATPEQLTRLRAFLHGKAPSVAATALGSQTYTIGKLLDGFGIKPASLEKLLGRLP